MSAETTTAEVTTTAEIPTTGKTFLSCVQNLPPLGVELQMRYKIVITLEDGNTIESSIETITALE